MQVRIRPAQEADAPGLLAIKNAIRLSVNGGESSAGQQGGFLLGTTLEEYLGFIRHDLVLVAEAGPPSQVVGFAIILPHASLAQSVLMQRASQVQWEGAFETRFSARRFAFFEQLGMLPPHRYRAYASYLALAITWQALQDHEALFTTVLRYPVVNTAALSFIQVVGFEKVGHVDESYPEYGRIKSDVYCLERPVFLDRLQQPRFERLLERSARLGIWQPGQPLPSPNLPQMPGRSAAKRR
jgi:hypothetical protein